MTREDTRKKIVDTAMDLFWKQGYQGTSTNELSAVAGLNKATVYQYFPNKEAIAVAAVRQMQEKTVTDVFAPAFAETEDPIGRIRGVYRRVYETHKKMYNDEGIFRGCPLVNMGLEMAISSDPVRRAVEESMRTLQSFYRIALEDLKAAGGLDAQTDTNALAADLQANMNAALLASKIERRPEAIQDGERRALRLLGA